MPPSMRVMVRCLKNQPKSQNSTQEPVRVNKSKLPIEPKLSGRMVAEVPSTRNILKILLPITLPTAMPVRPLSAAVIDVASSGSDVPAATTVRPITASLTPSEDAMPEAPFTKQSPP